MCDVDRYVDRLYKPSLDSLHIPSVIAQWHRYSGDLNRLPEDVDASTVIGHKNPVGKYARGFLWKITTKGDVLMPEAISPEIFKKLVHDYFDPFHHEMKKQILRLREAGFQDIYHIDAHSMPSLGTKEHRDPGEYRADFVISDQNGKSCRPEFIEMVSEAYKNQGFKIKINWPYIGGRITETYGQPAMGHHTVQVEMNRALYMDEKTKKYLPDRAAGIQQALTRALQSVLVGVEKFSRS